MTTRSEVIAEHSTGEPLNVSTVVIVTFAQLESMIAKYIIDSRTGETLSYRDTAALSTEDAAHSSAIKLWREFEEAGLVAATVTQPPDELVSPAVEMLEPPAGCVAVRLNSDLLIADEDIVAGQFCVISDKGHIRVATGEEVNLQPDAADPQQVLPLDLPVVTTMIADEAARNAAKTPDAELDVAALFGL